MLQNIKVSPNRSVTPKRIVAGNQFETGVEQIHFDLPDMEGYKYLVLNKPNKKESYPIPLDEGTFYVDSRITYYLDGVWIANVVISKSEVTTGKLNPEVVTFISDDIILIVKKNYINNEYLEDLPLPQNLQIVYDQLFNTYEQIKSDYDSGAFDGKDGYSPTLDVTPIENGNHITINDINGEKEIDVTNGIDGQSAYELAVKNGFEGTEQEWLESLRYDHSEEFTVLAEQVKQDAQLSAENADKAEQAMNQANQTSQANLGAIQSASQTAQSDINTAKQDAVNSVTNAQEAAEQSISAKHSEAVASIESAQSTAETAIDAKQTESVQAIESAKEEATQAIETGKTEAVAAITTAKDEAIEEIENTGVPLEDIEKLAIKETGQGNPTIISDSAEWRLQSLNVYGQSSQDGTPTPEKPVEIISKEVSEIKVTGKNLFDSSLCESKSGLTVVHNEDGSITVTGTPIAAYSMIYNSVLKLKKGTYTIKGGSQSTTNLYLQLYDKVNKKVYINKTFTLTDDVELDLTVQSGANISELNVTIYPILCFGTDGTFEPYKSQTITLSEPIILRGLPVDSGGNVTIDGQQYISDVADFETGKITRSVGVMTLDGSQLIGFSNGDAYHFSESHYKPLFGGEITNSKNNALCNRLITQNDDYMHDIGELYVSVDGSSMSISVKNFGDYSATNPISKEDAMAWFATHPTTIFAQLATPIVEDIPAEVIEQYKQLKTYHPNTVIDTGAWTKVEYVADTQKWIEKKLTGVTELALGGK